MSINYQPLISTGLARQVAESIREAILSGQLRADERLPTEEELASRFGVSRPTIREGLKRLAAMNLIHSRRGPMGGTFVKTPTLSESRSVVANAASLLVSMGEFNPEDIIEARRSLELSCIQLSVQRRTQEDLEALSREIEEQDNPQLSDEQFCASDVRFHQTLVHASHNPVLVFQAATVIDSLQPVLNLVIYKIRDRQFVVTQHSQILSALTEQNLPQAEVALRRYLDGLHELLIKRCQSNA
jgi:DNA-binding FadR family transcriptional regulator